MTRSPKVKKPYRRPDRGNRWYADFRPYRHVGGRQHEALRPDGATEATLDEGVALDLWARRLQELKDRAAGRAALRPVDPVRVRMLDALDQWETWKRRKRRKRVRASTLARDRVRLERLATAWGNPYVDTLTRDHLERWVDGMLQDGLTPSTVNKRIGALAQLLDAATDAEWITENVARRVERPAVVRPDEAPFLEPDPAWRLLCAADELDRDPSLARGRTHHPFAPLLYAALYTGGRKSELFALRVEDVDLAGNVVRFRPNAHYGERKSKYSVRAVPLWPDLRAVLRAHIGDRTDGYLFTQDGREPVAQLRGTLRAVFRLAGVPKPSGKEWHLFRHTYTAMRLQTLDHGAPVSPWTVKTELGHSTLDLIEKVYGHLPKDRRRADVVSYRPLLQVVGGAKQA